MPRLDLYIIRQLGIASLFIAIAVTMVMLFAMSFRLLSLVIENASTLGIFLKLMALTMPTFLPLVLPIATAIATVFIYHKLSMDSEIVVMRSAGLSPMRLAIPALKVGITVTVLCLIVTLFLAPWSNRQLVKLQYEVRNNFSVMLIRSGAFNDITPGLTFYARGRDKKGGLDGILIHDTRKEDVAVTIMAQNGAIVSREGEEPKIVVFNGVRQEYDKINHRLSQLDFENYTFDLRLLAGLPGDRAADPREMSLTELWANYRGKRMEDDAYSKRFLAEIFQRFASPMLALGFTCICAALMLSGEFNRRGMGRKLLTAAIVITVLQAMLLWVTNIVTRNIMFTPTLYCLTVLPFMIGLWILIREPQHKIPAVPQPEGAKA